MFGTILKELRQGCQLKQVDVAKILNVQSYVISDWEQERSEPSLDEFRKLCIIYDVPSDEVLGIDTADKREEALLYKEKLCKKYNEI